MNLSNHVKVTTILKQTSMTSTASTGAVILDMAGFDGVMYLATISVGSSDAFSWRMYPMHGDSSASTSLTSCTGAANLTGSTALFTVATHTSSILNVILDVVKPTKRWHCLYVNAASTNEATINALQYNFKDFPVTQSTAAYGVIDSDIVVNPTTSNA